MIGTIEQKLFLKSNEIKNIIENYIYFSFDNTQIQLLQTKIDETIKKIQDYINEPIIKLTLDWKKENLITENQKELAAITYNEMQEKNDYLRVCKAKIAKLVNFRITDLQYSSTELLENHIKAIEFIITGDNNKLETLLLDRNSLNLSLEPKFLIENNPELIPQNSLLVLAIENNNFPAVKMLCECGAQINFESKEFDFEDEYLFDEDLLDEIKTPFLEACKQNNMAMVDYLFKKGADPIAKHPNFSDTCLIIALENKNYQLFKKLITDYEVNFNDTSSGWNKNLYYLIQEASSEIVNFVLNNVRDIDLNQTDDFLIEDETPLTTLFTIGGIEINDNFSKNQQLLLTRQNKTKYLNKLKDFYKKMKLLINKSGLNINWQNDEGTTILHYIVNPSYKINRDFVEIFLLLGANQNLADQAGITPLMLAKTNNSPIIKKLLNNKQDILIPTNKLIPQKELEISLNFENKKKENATLHECKKKVKNVKIKKKSNECYREIDSIDTERLTKNWFKSLQVAKKPLLSQSTSIISQQNWQEPKSSRLDISIPNISTKQEPKETQEVLIAIDPTGMNQYLETQLQKTNKNLQEIEAQEKKNKIKKQKTIRNTSLYFKILEIERACL